MSVRVLVLNPAMRKRLQIALMASSVLATFLSLTTPYLRAQAGFASITTSIDSSGRKVYVNDETPVRQGVRQLLRSKAVG